MSPTIVCLEPEHRGTRFVLTQLAEPPASRVVLSLYCGKCRVTRWYKIEPDGSVTPVTHGVALALQRRDAVSSPA